MLRVSGGEYFAARLHRQTQRTHRKRREQLQITINLNPKLKEVSLIENQSALMRSNCLLETCDSNQLIVGPQRWAYKVLRHTLGERFMVGFAVRLFIKDF
jgi:hypothetical protein